MNLVGLAALGIAVLILVFVLHAGGDPSQAFIGMFGYRASGWPSGVQEDDDARWSWGGAGRNDPDADAAPRPTTEPLQPTLRRGRSR